jgi:hypothetical protein
VAIVTPETETTLTARMSARSTARSLLPVFIFVPPEKIFEWIFVDTFPFCKWILTQRSIKVNKL